MSQVPSLVELRASYGRGIACGVGYIALDRNLKADANWKRGRLSSSMVALGSPLVPWFADLHGDARCKVHITRGGL